MLGSRPFISQVLRLVFTACAFCSFSWTCASDFTTPTILSVEAPTNATYTDGAELEFEVNFSEPVFIVGTPQISLTIGSSVVNADYAAGSGSTRIGFSYTVQSGDLDQNGIEIGTLNLNGGTIRDAANDDADLTLNNVEDLSGVFVDAVIPAITAVQVPTDGTYGSGASLNFAVDFDDLVFIFGSPQLDLNIGGSVVTASYTGIFFATSMTFTYVVQAGELDLDGIEVASLSLNGGSIKDQVGNNADLTLNNIQDPSGVLVDAVGPAVLSVNGPTDDTYIIGETVNFQVNFDENANVTGTPQLSFTIGTSTVTADYTGGSGTASLSFSYTVRSGDEDVDGITVNSLSLNGGTIEDALANPATLTLNSIDDLSGVLVDGIVPTVTSVQVPADDTYGIGSSMDFIVNFSEPVNISGTPILSFDIGGSTVNASFTGGNGTTAITFSYTVIAGEEDTDGITVSSLTLNGGAIQDLVGNPADLTLTNVTDAAAVLVDGVLAIVTSVSVPVDDIYGEGEVLTFDVEFSEVVFVTGTPQLSITIGTSTVNADYTTGTSSNTLTFTYTVQSGDSDLDGISVNSLSLNGGNIADGGDNSANLTLNNIADPSGVLVDGIAPVVTAVNVPADGTYIENNQLIFVVDFSESLTVSGTPELSFVIGSSAVNATYSTGSGSSSLSFTYTVQPGDLDLDGITLTSLSLNGGSIEDIAGTDADLTLNNVADASNVLVDAVLPVVNSVSVPSDDTYILGETLSFVVNFNEAINVTGPPSLTLTIGTASVAASYVSGSGSSDLIFSYTVQLGDEDSDGISVDALVLNGGALQDLLGNSADLTLNSVGNTAAVLVEGVPPTVTSVNVPTDDTYISGESLNFIVNFSESVTVTGTPRLQLAVGTSTVNATFGGGSGSSALMFSYTISAGEEDTDGISVNTLDLNGGTIQDAVGNDAILTLNSVGSTTAVLVDAINPQVTITSTSSDPTGDNPIPIQIDFTESVSGFFGTDLSIFGGTVSNFLGTGSSYTFDLIPGGDGNITIDISAGVATDNAGNGNEAASQFQIESDGTAPTGYSATFDELLYTVANQNNASFTIANAEIGTTYNYEITDDNAAQIIGSGAVTGSPQAVTGIDLSSLEDGGLSLAITLTDAAGNMGSEEIDTQSSKDSSPPSIDPNQFFSIDEDAANNDVIGLVLANDPAGLPLTQWAIVSGNDDAVFEIDTSGQLSVLDNSTLDFEFIEFYSLSITAGNGFATSSPELVIVTINDLNDNLPVITASQLFAVDENETNGASIGTVAATDADDGTAFSDWTIVNSSLAGAISLDPSSGELTVADGSNIDFETEQQIDLSLTVRDGTNTSATETVTIAINDLNDNTPIVDPNQTFVIPVPFQLGASIGFIAATDADSNPSFSNWTIVNGNADNLFSLDPATGELTLSAITGIDQLSYTIGVIVSDGTNVSSSEEIELVVGDNESPTVSLSSVVTSATNVATQSITASFNEQVFGLTSSGITVFNGSASNLSSTDGITYTFDVTASAEGVVEIQIEAGVATDASANSNTASNTLSYFYDITPPVPTIVSSSGDATQNEEATVTIIFTEEVVGFTLNSLSSVNASFTDFSGASAAYQVISTSTVEGTVEVSIPANEVTDLAGNPNTATTVSWIIDQTPPEIFEVNILDEAINSLNQDNLRFEIIDGEEGATFSYSANAMETVADDGLIENINNRMIISGVDVTSLADGVIGLSVILTDEAGNSTGPISAEVIKNTTVEIPQGFNPNKERWIIPGIENYPNNKVVIFNRFGSKVWEVNGYDNDNNSWDGMSNASAVIGNGGVPDGTYFYVLEFSGGDLPTKSGFVIIKR